MQNLSGKIYRTFSFIRGYGQGVSEDPERTAAHEAGHALIAVLQNRDIDFVTIDMGLHPHMKPYDLIGIWDNVRANGIVRYKTKSTSDNKILPEEQRKKLHNEVLHIVVAGAAAEEVAKPECTAELSGIDLSSAYQNAQELIMPPPIPEPLGLIENITWLHRIKKRETTHSTPEHHKTIDRIIADARDQVKATLITQQKALFAVAGELLDKHIIDGETVRRIVTENLVPAPAA